MVRLTFIDICTFLAVCLQPVAGRAGAPVAAPGIDTSLLAGGSTSLTLVDILAAIGGRVVDKASYTGTPTSRKIAKIYLIIMIISTMF